jgi:PAS domain S-box-containing protein
MPRDLIEENRQLRQRVEELEKAVLEKAQSEGAGSKQSGQPALPEETFRLLFENALDGIFLTRPDGRVDAANPAACKILGMTKEEIIRAGRDRILNLKDPRVAAGLEERARTGKTSGVITFLRKDGTPFPVEIHSSIYRDSQGEPRAFTIFRDITERSRAENALRRSEERFMTLFRASPVAIAVTRLKDSRLYDVNSAWETMTGFRREEALGRTSGELNMMVNPTLRERIIEGLLKGEKKQGFEVQLKSKSGVVIDVLMSAELIEMDGEEYVLSLAQDITTRKETEKRLCENEARYRTVLEDQTEVIARFSANGTFIFVNEVYCHFFGKTREDLIGKRWQPMAVPEDVPMIQERLRTLSSANPVIIIENRVHSEHDQVHWMQFVNRGFFSPDGELIEIQSVGRDITERKRLEEKLRVSEQFQRAVIDGLSANVAVIDETGTILAVNKAWREFADANPPVLRNVCEGANYIQVCESAKGRYSGGAAQFLKAIRKAFLGELDYFEIEYPCHSPDRERWFCGRVTPFSGEGPRAVVVAHENITERKQAERQIKIYQKKLRAMGSQMVLADQRERRRFSADLHDRVGQNLALAKIKLGGLSKSKASPRQLAIIRETDDLVENTIRSTRSLIYEISPPILPELGLAAAVEWISEYFQEQYRIPVELKITGKPVTIKEDLRILFFNALRELLNNIAKHAKAKHVRIFLIQGKEEARIMVEDDGVGIGSFSFKKRLSKKNFGIFNIQEQFKHIGGKFKIISSPGKGTKAILVMPIKSGAKRKQRRG